MNTAPETGLDADDDLPASGLLPAEDAAFIAAKNGEEFLGAELQPWTPQRIIAAQSMGMLYPLIGEDGWEQLGRTGIYAGAMRDTIIFLWLRALLPGETFPQSTARAARAERKPGEAWARAQAWAEQLGLLDAASETFQEGYQLFGSKMAAIQAARGIPETAGAPAAADQKKSNPEPVGGVHHDGGGGEL